VAGQADLNLADGMHPNAQGHVIVAAHVLAFLRPKLRALVLGAPKKSAGPKILRRRNPLEGAPL
jgi:hypothetical protein